MTFVLLGLLIFLAHLFNAWFSRRRIPDVLLLMIIGLIAGPLTGLVSESDLSEVGSVVAGVTLFLILFDSGVDLRIDSIRQYWTGVVQVTLLSFVCSMAAVTAIAYFWVGLRVDVAMLLGTMVAGTAAAIVIPLVRQMRVSDKTRVTLTLESAISGVLCIVISLAFVEGFKMAEQGGLSMGTMIGKVLASFLMAIIIGLVCGIVWSAFMDRIRKKQHSLFLTPAFVSILYGFCELLGYSGAIAALAFGIVLGNTEYFELPFLRHSQHRMTPLQESERGFFSEIIFLLKTFFFVYIGICIPFRDGWALLYGAVIAAVLFAVRFALIAIVGRNNTAEDRLIVSMMIPKGLVSAVLASMPEQVNAGLGYELIPHATLIKEVAYAVIFFSIIICSLLVLTTSRRLVRDKEELVQDHTLQSDPWNEEQDYEG